MSASMLTSREALERRIPMFRDSAALPGDTIRVAPNASTIALVLSLVATSSTTITSPGSMVWRAMLLRQASSVLPEFRVGMMMAVDIRAPSRSPLIIPPGSQ